MVLALSFHAVSVYKASIETVCFQMAGEICTWELSLCFPCSPSSSEPNPDSCGCINAPAPLLGIILGHELCTVSSFHLGVSISCPLQFLLNSRPHGDLLPFLYHFLPPLPESLAPANQHKFLAQRLLLKEPELRQSSSLATS